MVTYAFYVNDYMGSQIPENAFPGLAARAADALERMKRIYRVTEYGDISRNMALCAMAECIHEDSRRRGIHSANVGSVTVRYNEKNLIGELYDRAGTYLDICRGVV